MFKNRLHKDYQEERYVPKQVLHRCISHSIPDIKLSLRILLTSRKPTQPLWAQGWCWGWHSSQSLAPGLHLHFHLLLHLLQLQPLLPALRPCQAHGVVADAVGKDCKILFKALISTWLEKLWGCCWMVTVMFSCQELPGWSVPGLLFAFLKKILFLTLYVGKSNPITIAIFMFSEALVSDHLWRYVLTSVND